MAEREDNRVAASNHVAVDANVDGFFDGDSLVTYNQSVQRPPQVSTVGVVKHSAKQPTELEVCFRMLRPPHTCTDPTCKRLHDVTIYHSMTLEVDYIASFLPIH